MKQSMAVEASEHKQAEKRSHTSFESKVLRVVFASKWLSLPGVETQICFCFSNNFGRNENSSPVNKQLWCVTSSIHLDLEKINEWKYLFLKMTKLYLREKIFAFARRFFTCRESQKKCHFSSNYFQVTRNYETDKCQQLVTNYIVDVSQSIRHKSEIFFTCSSRENSKIGKAEENVENFLYTHRHSPTVEIFVYQPKVRTWFPTCRLHDSEKFSLAAKNLPESWIPSIDPIWFSVNWVAVPWQSFVSFTSKLRGWEKFQQCLVSASGFSIVWPDPRLDVASISLIQRSIESALWNCVIKTNQSVKSKK